MTNDNVTYEEALRDAQEQGIAESNPILDVEGYDTGSKLIILANVLMDGNLSKNNICIEGITKLKTEELSKLKYENKKVKLIGKVEKVNGSVKGYVKPVIIDSNHPLYGVDYKNKGIFYRTDTLGDITVIGGASGTINAAASILRDIVQI